MVYIMLSEKTSNSTQFYIQSLIIEYVKQHIKLNNFEYKLVFNKQHITENSIEHINREKDIVLWNPSVAYQNMEVLKTFVNSIVILEKPSIYIQKVSELNPITENMAVNNGFFIVYINPESDDITNSEYKMIVENDTYLFTTEKLLELIRSDIDNEKKEKVEKFDFFEGVEEITNMFKNQINLD